MTVMAKMLFLFRNRTQNLS